LTEIIKQAKQHAGRCREIGASQQEMTYFARNRNKWIWIVKKHTKPTIMMNNNNTINSNNSLLSTVPYDEENSITEWQTPLLLCFCFPSWTHSVWNVTTDCFSRLQNHQSTQL